MAKQLNVNMSFTADTSKAKQQIQDLQKSLQSLYSNSAQTLPLDKEVSNALNNVAKLKVALEQATNASTGNLDLSKFNQQLRQGNLTLQGLSKDFINLGPQGEKAFTQLTHSIVNAETPMRQVSGLMSTMWTTLKNVARFQISSSIIHGLVGGVQAAYGYAQDLNESLNNIRIVTGQSVDQMRAFAEQANKSAKALSSSTLDYTNASLIYYQQGLDDDAVKARTDVTIKMANVARESAETVSEQMTAIWNNFDDGSKSLEYYADVITALGAATASSSSEISQGLEKFAAVADTVGLSYENATAALATITATTRQSADTVGTGLRTLFSRLQGLKLGDTLEDGVDLNKYSKALEAVGVHALDASGNLRRMDDVLEDLGERWDELSKAQQTALAQTVGGVRQYTTLIALMDNWDFMKQNQEVAANAEGTLQEQADIYAESWEAAQKRVQTAAQAIYQDLINDDFFITLLNGIEKILTGIDKFIDSIGGLQGVLPLLSTALLTAFGPQIANSINNLIHNIDIMRDKGAQLSIQVKQEAIDALKTFNAGLNKNSADRLEGTVQQIELERTIELQKQVGKLSEEERKYRQELIAIEKKYGDVAVAAKRAVEAATKSQTDQIRSLKLAAIDKGTTTQLDKLLDKLREKVKAAAATSGEDFNDALLRNIQTLQQDAKACGVTSEQLFKLGQSMHEVTTTIDASTKASENYQAEQGKVRAALSETTITVASYGQTFVNVAQSLSSIIFGITNIVNSLETLNDETATVGQKLTSVFTGLTMGLPMVISGFQKLTSTVTPYIQTISKLDKLHKLVTMGLDAENAKLIAQNLLQLGLIKTEEKDAIIQALQNKLTKEHTSLTLADIASVLGITLAKEGETTSRWANVAAAIAEKGAILGVLSVIWPYLVAVGAVVGIIALLVKAYKTMEEQQPEKIYERATEATQKHNEILNETTSYLTDLKSKWDTLNSAQDTLKTLTRGTEEWNQKILEINSQVLELIDKYPTLLKFLDTTGDAFSINPEGFEQLNKELTESVQKMQEIQLMNTNYLTYLKQNIDDTARHNQLIKSVASSYNNTYSNNDSTKEDSNLAPRQRHAQQHVSATSKNERSHQQPKYETSGGTLFALDLTSAIEKGTIQFDKITQQYIGSNSELVSTLNKDINESKKLIATIENDTKIRENGQESTARGLFDAAHQSQIAEMQSNNQYYNSKAYAAYLSQHPDLLGFDFADYGSQIQSAIADLAKEDRSELINKYLAATGLDQAGYYGFKNSLIDNNGNEVEISDAQLAQTIALKTVGALSDVDWDAIFQQINPIQQAVEKSLIDAGQNLDQSIIDDLVAQMVGGNFENGTTFTSTFEGNPYQQKESPVNAEELKNYGLEEASIRQQMTNIQEQYNNDAQKEQIELIQAKKKATADAAETTKNSTKEILKQLDAENKLIKAEKVSEEAAYNLAVQNQRMNKGVETLSSNWEDWSDILKNADRTGKDYADTVVAVTDSVKELVGAEGDFVLPDGWLDAPGNMELLGKAAEGDINAINELGFSIANATIALLQYNAEWQEAITDDDGNVLRPAISEDAFEQSKNNVLAGIEALQQAVKDGTVGIGDDISSIGDTLGTNWVESLNEMARVTGMSVDEMNSLLNELGVQAEVTTTPVHQEVSVPIYETTTEVKNPGDPFTHNGMVTRTFTRQVDTKKMTGVVDVAQINMGDDIGTPPKITYVGNGPVSTSSVKSNNSGGKGSGGSSSKSSAPKTAEDRYHDTLNRREKTKNAFDKAQSEKEELWGQARIDKWKEAQKALEDYIKAQQDLLKDTERWLKTDKKALQDALSKIDITITPQFDENGTITNYEAILEQINNLYQKYNGNEDMIALIEAAQKALEQYDKTSDLWIDRKKELDDLNKQLDKLRKEEQIEQKERERYHRIERQLAENDRKLDEVRTKAERAHGLEKIKWLEEEQRLLIERNQLQQEYIKEIEETRKYLNEDKNKLVGSLTELGIDIKFDENGDISNIEEIFDQLIAAWNNGNNTIFGTDPEEAKKKYDAVIDALAQYEKTLDLLHNKEKEVADIENEIIDKALEIITTKVELKISISDRDLKRIDYALKHIEDDVYKTAEALALMGKQGDESMAKIAAYEQGITEIFQEAFGKLEFSINDLINMSDEELQAALNGMTEESRAQVEAYCDALREEKLQLMELQDTIREKVMAAYDELNAKVDEAYEKFDKFTGLLEHYKTIVELSAGTLGIFTKSLQDSIQANLISNAENQTEAARKRLEQAKKDLEQYTGDDPEMLKKLQDNVAAANEAFLSSIENTLQLLKDSYDTTFNEIFDNLNKWIDNAEKAYNRQKELNDEYLTDYEKTYQLNKLARDLDKTLNNTNSAKGRARLLELQKEINDGMADANRLSAYDVEFLQKKLALEQARLDLENARNAKSYMQLQRGADGQWGYVYTADEAAVEQAEQAYEDRQHDIYELQKRQEENLTTQLHSLASSWSQAKRELDERRASGELTEEQYQAEYAKQEAFYKERARYIFEQMGNLFDNNNWADQMYNMGLAMGIDESTLKNILESDNLEDAMNLFLDHFSDAQTASDEAYATYQNRVSAFFADNGVTAKTLQDAIEQIGTGSKENIDEVTKASLELSNEFRKDVIAANTELAKLDASIKSVTDKLDPLTERLYNLMNVLDGGTPMDLSGVDLTKDKTIIDKTPPIGILPTPINPPVSNTTSSNTGVPSSTDRVQSLYQSALAALNNNYFAQIGSDFLRLLMPQIPRIISDALDQTVQITASFPSVVDHNEIEEAFNNLINKATQYANRKTMWSQTFGDNYNY